MRLLFSLTKGEHVMSFRRSFVIGFAISFLLLMGLGATLDLAARARSDLLAIPYTLIFTCAIVLTILYLAILGVLFSTPRFARRRAVRRCRGSNSVLLNVYLTVGLRDFVESVTTLRLNDIAESITFEFRRENIIVWHGAGSPKFAQIYWSKFPVLRIDRLGPRSVQLQFIRPHRGEQVLTAFAPVGILGVRYRGLVDLVASIHALDPRNASTLNS